MKTKNITAEAHAIWNLWKEMWNGDLEKANLIIEDGFFPNLLSNKMVIPEAINSAQKVQEWVKLVRCLFQTLEYETLAGPFVDEQQKVLCCHWKATGIFSGKTDYPSDVAGNGFLIEGTDILKFKDGKIYKCWTQSDVVTRTE